jgi:hypothetical protein
MIDRSVLMGMVNEAASEAYESVFGGDDNVTVLKTVKAKKEWVQKFNELHKKYEELVALKREFKIARDLLWATIRSDSDDLDPRYDGQRYNEESGEIEYYTDEKEE